jgi:hypothetical protein
LQNGFGLLYANRLSVRAGARFYAVSGPAWADGLAGMGASIFGRATLTWTPVLGRGAAIHPTSYLEAWCRPDLATDSGMPYGITYRIAASL